MATFHLPSIEDEQLKKWEARDIFVKVMQKPAPAGNFVFFEGPPTANGKPGLHHLLARAFKDVIPRYKTMRGYRVERKAGWDTHGLPVELEVEKKLGFTKKQDIENYGIARFNEKCRESVWMYRDLFEQITRRLGYWVDMAHPYVTYENNYIESLWWILQQIDAKGLLDKGFRITPHCPRCVTSLSSHELAQGYKDTEDPSVYVKFAVAGADEGAAGAEKKFFLVWTTTPWTLPANVALAVGADVDYVEVRMQESGEIFVLAKARLEVLTSAYDIVAEYKGSTLVGAAFTPLFATLGDAQHSENAYKVYAADFVSTSDGTGIVHIAPAYGEDDAKLGLEKSLPTLFSVDTTGMVTADVPGKGQFFKKADAAISADLTARGLMYASGTVMHSYPFCWRCGTPVLYFAKSSWYIRMSTLRNTLVEANEKIHWEPAHIRDGRFGEWLREVKDWAISRERYWGTPLPVWFCDDCGERKVIGSFQDLTDARRPKNNYFLLRHGEAETNATNTVSSWPEPKEMHLTDTGRAQAQTVAEELRTKHIDLIFSSDLLRTRETAMIVASTLKKNPETDIFYDERLREIQFGVFNGKTEREFHSSFANKLVRFDQFPEGGENLLDVRRRMVAFVRELEGKYSGKNILIVSHGDPIWMLETGLAELSHEDALALPYNHVGKVRELADIKNLPRDDQGHVDMHRPFIDEVMLQCGKCQGVMHRVPDVMDVWFDPGSMPFAQWHYPFENRERIEQGTNYPADYICEAIDQTRGWFYVLLAVSACLGYTDPPYKNVICLGHILDAKGLKMSKSKGNIVDPMEAMQKYGADALRYYFFTVNQPGEAKRYDEKAVDDVAKKVFVILWNVLSYYQMFSGDAVAPLSAPAPKNILDQWILSRLAGLTKIVSEKLDDYVLIDAGRAIGEFVNELSTWYVRRSRDRFKSGSDDEKKESVATLGYVLRTLSLLMAPFTPFLADALYDAVGGEEESVHLLAWPEVSVPNDALEKQMSLTQTIASLGLERRAAAGIPVRQALASATVIMSETCIDWMKKIIAEELNVEEVRCQIGEKIEVTLDTVLTPALKEKGALRELVRTVNGLRKDAGLTLRDRVIIAYVTDSAFWKNVLTVHGAALVDAVLADSLVEGKKEAMHSKEVVIDNESIWVAI